MDRITAGILIAGTTLTARSVYPLTRGGGYSLVQLRDYVCQMLEVEPNRYIVNYQSQDPDARLKGPWELVPKVGREPHLVLGAQIGITNRTKDKRGIHTSALVQVKVQHIHSAWELQRAIGRIVVAINKQNPPTPSPFKTTRWQIYMEPHTANRYMELIGARQWIE